ncbi:enoyl-CoA hydratase/isomerase family protein [Saccharomonospora piscinae]|uniref:enoyl-CoA hydratase-related protein n=1 Tax=Saccharomonospora piscinae TaxID=687388 RepID=UPI001106FD97|nr:enoyl-CoA hydratase-related protein [Saccharomonospora piscinae]TLW90448.1 enoyl-CoA hydratase/isomerase family protein [Saccharomonospora piscinae]
MPILTQHADVAVLDLGAGENRFHLGWIAETEAALDKVATAEGPRALVTVADGKFFSNGLDLEWASAHPDRFSDYLASVERLLARVLTLPLVTTAVVQGHAFAAGAMFTLAHDFRIMRADRGFWCLPEADLGLPFSPGMSALIQARLTPQTAHAAMTTGRRYGGEDALAAGIVDRVAGEAELRETALALAASQAGRASAALATIKETLYAPVLRALRHEGG